MKGGNIHEFIRKASVKNFAVSPIQAVKDILFSSLDLPESLKMTIARHGYTVLTPIQVQGIPAIRAGKDVIGIANTGTGKTAAFLIPLIENILKDYSYRALIISPTRELALQTRDELRKFSGNMPIFSTLCIGQSSMQIQISQLKHNPHVVVGTPGRIKDLINRGILKLGMFKMIILDETDQMLDMGFIHDIKEIISYLPLEMFENGKVDYAITGGDYDFVAVNLLNHIHKGEALEGGVYWRASDKKIKAKPVAKLKLKNGKEIFHSGPASLKHDLNSLPFVDRDLTKWKLYAYENGNYKYTPGTYMYSGRDCWWNRCTFCVWDHTINPRGSYRSFTPERLFAEVKHVVDNYGIKEIFDDAGTMFIGPKLKKFCELLISSGYNKKVVYGCNMRFNALTQEYYDLMGKAGFRFILYRMESANQKTLDKLDKGTKEADTINGSRMASKAGLEPLL